jgi:ribosomal 50S subunit-recycling heat shock protein
MSLANCRNSAASGKKVTVRRPKQKQGRFINVGDFITVEIESSCPTAEINSTPLDRARNAP